MGPQKEEDKSIWTLDPPDYIAWHLCMLIQRDQKRPSSWHNHCFLPHKEQNLQVRGGDLFLYKGNFIPCLCTCFCFVGCRIWESLLDEARGNPDLRWEKSSFWHLGNRRLFFAIFSPSLQDGNVFFVTFAYFFLKEIWIFVICSLWVVLRCSFMDKKKKRLIKKTCELHCLLCCVDTDEQLGAAKRTKTDFINTQAVAVDEKQGTTANQAEAKIITTRENSWTNPLTQNCCCTPFLKNRCLK